MSDKDHVIPFDRLPPGFAETVKHIPDEPVPTRPAATSLLLRDGPTGMETLMLRRTRRSGFVPGAWVFAGGRVDAGDGEDGIAERLTGLTHDEAALRLGLRPSTIDSPPAIAFYAAALREAFEETGILVAERADGSAVPSAGEDPEAGAVRDRLLADEIDFGETLDLLGAHIDASRIEYVAHWITPVQEPRRYDTRFFAAKVDPAREFALSPSEMSEGRWLTPEDALALHTAGELPMVFPTIRTLEDFCGFQSVDESLESFGAKPVPAILPRLVVTPTGVGLEVD